MPQPTSDGIAVGSELFNTIVNGYLTALNDGEVDKPDHVRSWFCVDTRRRSKYLRVMACRPGGEPYAAHAFIDTRDASLHMAASMAAPVRNRAGELQPRYQLADADIRNRLFTKLATGSGCVGGYLDANSRYLDEG
jgi:hypothetical protein